jgi:hypothetical protein
VEPAGGKSLSVTVLVPTVACVASPIPVKVVDRSFSWQTCDLPPPDLVIVLQHFLI